MQDEEVTAIVLDNKKNCIWILYTERYPESITNANQQLFKELLYSISGSRVKRSELYHFILNMPLLIQVEIK